MFKNYNREGQKLPLFGVGPYMVLGMASLTFIGIILIGYVFKIGSLGKTWILLFRIVGVMLIVSGIAVWFIGAMCSDMDNNIENNKLKTDGIYAWVRNPMYSGWWIVITGITLMWHNAWMLVLPVMNWLIMTLALIKSEEKWLLEIYDEEYALYKTKVNRCIPWKPSNDRTYVTDISTARWMVYDIPGNIGWIIYIGCLIKCFVSKPSFLSSGGLLGIMIIAVIPAILMMIGIVELISERFAKLDRVLPEVRLKRGFGSLVSGGIMGWIISAIGVAYGFFIGEKEMLLIVQMLLGGLLCSVFVGLIYKTYK